MSSPNKVIIFLLGFIILILISLNFSFISSANSDQKIKVSQEITNALEKNNSVRVFIKFKDSSTDSGKKLSSIKKDFKSTLSNSKIRNDFGNTLSAEISEQDLVNLEGDSSIESISLVGLKHLALQDSVPLINATKTWGLQTNLRNLTGNGQAVCVIDTGITYTHSDLGGCFGDNNVSSICKVVGGWNTFSNNNDLTDLNGHGTHVSGIIAANGTLKGVAPDARIVFIKAYDDANGGFWDDDIVEAINWCVANSSVFNISVISMSLGGNKNFTTYCDNASGEINENSDIFADPINQAFAKNISVVIASGNSGNYTGISSPACIQNATPVGSSTKADSISSFSNRNSLVQLLAPGSSISSTWKDGGYATASGTSMATPHVAGAIVILNQYFKSTSQTKTPAQIESIFNSSGKQISDSSSGLNFSRVDLYTAVFSVLSLYNSLISPSNNNFTNQNLTNFNCSAETYTRSLLTNITFSIWNSTGVLIYNSTQAVSGVINSTNYTFAVSLEGAYSWNCLSFNNVTNSSWANSNFTFTYDKTSPQIVLNSPENDSSYTTSDTISFSYNITENFNTSNCSLIANGVVVSSNSTIGNFSSSSFSNSFSAGNYNWSINCSDSAGNQNSSETRNITITQAVYTPSGGSGGGSSSRTSSSSTQVIKDTQMILGYSPILQKSNKLTFNLQDSSNHSLTINTVSFNSVNLTLASNPLNLTLIIGEEKKVNLSSSEYYDLYLKLNSISGVKANLTIRSIYEAIDLPKKIEEPTLKYPMENNTETINSSEKTNNNNYIILICIIFVLILVIILLKHKPNKTKKYR